MLPSLRSLELPREVNATETVRALRRCGYEAIRQTVLHVIRRREHRTVVVRKHKLMKPGTLSGPIVPSGRKVEEIVAQL